MKLRTLIEWVLQLIAAFILLQAAYAKFASNPGAVATFAKLGMEPAGRYIIGVLEAIAGLLLLLPFSAATGALLGFGVMLGAGIAHFTKLGFGSVEGTMMWVAVLICTGLATWLRRDQLPIFGETMHVKE